MKCQILFSGKNKKNITDLLSAESAHCMVFKKTINQTKSEKFNFIWSYTCKLFIISFVIVNMYINLSVCKETV